MIATVKKELLTKIHNIDDEVLLKQISLMLDNGIQMQLNADEKKLLDEAFMAINNDEVSSNEIFQDEWDKWLEK
jgi:hypothetical protein